MLKRNLGVKLAPQRWQDNVADGSFDIVFAFEEKVFDMILEGDNDSTLLFLEIGFISPLKMHRLIMEIKLQMRCYARLHPRTELREEEVRPQQPGIMLHMNFR